MRARGIARWEREGGGFLGARGPPPPFIFVTSFETRRGGGQSYLIRGPGQMIQHGESTWFFFRVIRFKVQYL